MKQLRTAPRDWVALAVCLLVLGGLIGLNVAFGSVLK